MAVSMYLKSLEVTPVLERPHKDLGFTWDAMGNFCQI